MGKLLSRLAVLFCSLLCLHIQFSQAQGHSGDPQEGSKVVKVTTGDWLPYVSSGQPHSGALAHIIKTAFNRAGYQVKFEYFPWTRGYQLVQDGEFDATMPYYCSSDREKLFHCSEPLVDGEQVFFHLKGTTVQWDTLEDLRGVPIGATLGYFYGEQFESAENNGVLSVKRIASDKKNMQLLFLGRIKLFPQDKEVGYSTVRNLYPEMYHQLTHHPMPIHTKSLHLIFPRNNPRSEKLLAIFNEQLLVLKEEGKIPLFLEAMRRGDYENSAAPVIPE